MSVSKHDVSKPPAALANPDYWEEILRMLGTHISGLSHQTSSRLVLLTEVPLAMEGC